MKIGIDARFLTHPQVGGFKTYTANLVNALSEVDQDNTYVIYVDRPPIQDALPQKDNLSYRVVEGTLPVIGMPYREQVTLRRSIARDKLDIVHFLCNTAPVKVTEKYVVTLHDIIQLTAPNTFQVVRSLANHKRWAMTAYSKWTILQTVRAASRIITVSSYEKSQIVEHLGITPERVCVTHLAPNALFTPADIETKRKWLHEVQDKFGLKNKFVLGVGYEPRKNIPLLIDAFSLIASEHPDVDLVIVAAEERSRLDFEELAQKKKLEERVFVLAKMPPSDLATLYNLTEVFLYPSERESFGLPPLEAMACGAPTIALNKSSLPEILQDGALFIDNKDPQAWANAIGKVIVDKSLRYDLTSRGQEQAARMNWQRCALDTLHVYYSAAEER